jgi:hypothetical protein
LRGLVALVRLVVEVEDSAFEKEETLVKYGERKGEEKRE